MRRPVPLPADPDAPEEPTAPATDDDLGFDVVIPGPRRPGGDPASAPSPDPEELLGSPAPREPQDERGDVDPHPAFDGTVGVREVWAAARARRKALRAEVRRFTARQRRRRMVWIGVVSALAVLVLGSIAAAYSPLFAVERVRVVGTSALDADEVEAALSGQLGTPLSRIDSSQVKASLVQFPLVETYTLEARPPHELVVRIVERTPIGAVTSAAGYTLVDAAGVALDTTPDAPEGYPTITATGGVDSPAFAAIGTVYRSLPDDIRDQVTAMKATTANDVTLTLGKTTTDVVWGNADDSARKAVVLAAAMEARPPTHVYSYDVSSPDAVVIR